MGELSSLRSHKIRTGPSPVKSLNRMTILNAKNLTLREVHQLLGYRKLPGESFTDVLSLAPLSEYEQLDLARIRTDFESYLLDSKVLEGQVKLLAVGPLLRLAGFYSAPLKISLEQNIADIAIEDGNKTIVGRLDILVSNKSQPAATDVAFWVLVIETKNSGISSLEALPQLLTYAYDCLERQETVWGLVTNGTEYRFVLIRQGDPPTYQWLSLLSLLDADSSIQLLQVLKAICQIQNAM